MKFFVSSSLFFVSFLNVKDINWAHARRVSVDTTAGSALADAEEDAPATSPSTSPCQRHLQLGVDREPARNGRFSLT